MLQFLIDEWNSTVVTDFRLVIAVSISALVLYGFYKLAMSLIELKPVKYFLAMVFIIFANCIALLFLIWLVCGIANFNGYWCALLTTLGLLVAFCLTVIGDHVQMHE